MKHRTKKKGHGHGKHHKHKVHNVDGRQEPSKNDGDLAHPTTTTPTQRDEASAVSPSTRGANSQRGSMCEYCGAGSLADGLAGEGFDDDSFDCADDCERFTFIDVNSVTCKDAYQLRSPDLTAFFCQSGVVLGEIHSLVRLAQSLNGVQGAFNENAVLSIRPKLIALFAKMTQIGVGPSQTNSSMSPPNGTDEDGEDCFPRRPTCPFVMVLSVLLPTLHKFLQYTQLTKHNWWLLSGVSAETIIPPVELLATQLQLHDLLTQVVAESGRLARLIEENEERDQDITRLVQPLPLTPRRSGGYSSSSSSSSLSSSVQSRPSSADERDATLRRLPQIRKISFEFEEWLAESKFELAELSEAMIENVEILALRLSRNPLPPPVAGSSNQTTGSQPPKSKNTANEFVEYLVQHLLSPLSSRVTKAPSTSRSYIFPRIVDRCISVAVDEYVVENGKWSEQTASQFEKAIELFRSWAISVDAEYDKQLISAPRDVARLTLLSMDAFRRLDILLHTWLRHGKDGEAYVPRLTFRTNLENLRSTLKKTMTARGAGLGVATPPPVV